MVEDATSGLVLNMEEYNAVQKEVNIKMTKDKIRWLEDRGYRVILNNTKNNTNRDNDMIMILEANG